MSEARRHTLHAYVQALIDDGVRLPRGGKFAEKVIACVLEDAAYLAEAIAVAGAERGAHFFADQAVGIFRDLLRRPRR